jgi:hypothetical protein
MPIVPDPPDNGHADEALRRARAADDRAVEKTYEQLLAADHLTADELEYLICREGRNHGPAVLFDAWFGKRIDRDTLAAVIGGVWSGAEYPDQCIDRIGWRHLFRAAGFTIDGKPAQRPDDPIRLWRGTVPERRTDWSWTTDRTIAEGYANGTAARRPKGRLYTVLAPPEALLCANNCRDEAEYVVDTRGLQIREAGR